MGASSLFAQGVMMDPSLDGKIRLSTEEINALNQRCYDARADYWDRFPFADFLPQALQKAIPSPKGMKALDIGSGTGKFAAWLKKQGFEVLCLDPSPEMVGRCRHLGLETIQTTLQNYFSPHSFDLITAILSLIHIPKHEIAEQLAKISSWQKNGGILVLAVIEGEGERVAETQSPFPRFFAYYSKSELLKILDSNYKLIDEYRVGGTICYQVLILRKTFRQNP